MKFSEFLENTSAGDIAGTEQKLGLNKRLFCEECGKNINESPVGLVGRTGMADAIEHVTPELRAEFKKMVIKLGGKAVCKHMLDEMTFSPNNNLKGE